MTKSAMLTEALETTPLADLLPKLPLPPMPEPAREVLRRLIEQEQPYGYSSMDKMHGLAEARGWSIHPKDWMPVPNEDFHPDFYQLWVDWIAENGLMPYHKGIPLTDANWDRWKPAARRDAFKKLVRKDRAAARKLLQDRAAEASAKERKWFLEALYYDGSCGLYGADAWTVQGFVNDRAGAVASYARKIIDELDGRRTVEDDARELATRFELRDDGAGAIVTIISDEVALREPSCFRLIRAVTLEVFAEALSMTSVDLARLWDIDMKSTHSIDAEFRGLLLKSGDHAARRAYAERMIDDERWCPPRLLDDDLRARALRIECGRTNAAGWNIDGLLQDLGTLPISLVRTMPTYDGVQKSIRDELNDGKLPVNKAWDPLRTLGYLADREAAQSVLDEAIGHGLASNNPRLNMLHYNIALTSRRTP